MRGRAACLLLVLGLTLPAEAQQQPAEPRRGAVLSVRGEGRAEAKPDFALLDVTVSTSGRSADEAATAHRERATRALTLLQGLYAEGVGIERSTFRLDQDRPPPPVPGLRPDTRPPAPFTAQTIFSLKATAIGGLNAVVSRLAASGLFEVRSVRFKVDEERAALNRARRAAMMDAREQAQAYADAGDLRLVEIVEVTDGQAAPAPDGQADLPLPRFVQIIPPANVAFDASVTVTWRIAPR